MTQEEPKIAPKKDQYIIKNIGIHHEYDIIETYNCQNSGGIGSNASSYQKVCGGFGGSAVGGGGGSNGTTISGLTQIAAESKSIIEMIESWPIEAIDHNFRSKPDVGQFARLYGIEAVKAILVRSGTNYIISHPAVSNLYFRMKSPTANKLADCDASLFFKYSYSPQYVFNFFGHLMPDSEKQYLAKCAQNGSPCFDYAVIGSYRDIFFIVNAIIITTNNCKYDVNGRFTYPIENDTVITPSIPSVLAASEKPFDLDLD